MLMLLEENIKRHKEMKARDLYNKILASQFAKNVCETTICGLHKACNITECPQKQNSLLIDFDKVQSNFCKEQKRSTDKSTDGVVNSIKRDNVFYFVELKSIHNIVINPISKAVTRPEDVKHKIKLLVDSLAEKLNKSEKLCTTISGEIDLFSQLLPVLVLVTDIDIYTSPFAKLRNNIHMIEVETELKTNQKLLTNVFTPVYHSSCMVFDVKYTKDDFR